MNTYVYCTVATVFVIADIYVGKYIKYQYFHYSLSILQLVSNDFAPSTASLVFNFSQVRKTRSTSRKEKSQYHAILRGCH